MDFNFLQARAPVARFAARYPSPGEIWQTTKNQRTRSDSAAPAAKDYRVPLACASTRGTHAILDARPTSSLLVDSRPSGTLC